MVSAVILVFSQMMWNWQSNLQHQRCFTFNSICHWQLFQIYKLQYFLLNRAAGFGREQFRHQLGCNRTSNIELFNQKNFSFETNKIDYFWLLTTTLRPFKPLWRKKCDFLQQKTIFKLNLLLRETSIWSHVVTGTNQSNHFESFTLLIFLSFLTAF